MVEFKTVSVPQVGLQGRDATQNLPRKMGFKSGKPDIRSSILCSFNSQISTSAKEAYFNALSMPLVQTLLEVISVNVCLDIRAMVGYAKLQRVSFTNCRNYPKCSHSIRVI